MCAQAFDSLSIGARPAISPGDFRILFPVLTLAICAWDIRQ
jgi:hypothetical protein